MSNLGIIPNFQFSMDPARNPNVINMPFPPGMTQTSLQPGGSYFNSNMSGHSVNLSGTGALNLGSVDQVNAVFESFWWRHRKAIVVGSLAALALGIVGGVAAILR